MSNQVFPRYYHLKSKWIGTLWSDPPQAIPAAFRILALADLENERMVNDPGLSATLTIEELKQFKRDDQILAKCTLNLADHTPLSPDPVGGFAYFDLFHNPDILVDPPSHAIALRSQNSAPDAGIPVLSIHGQRFKTVHKAFPRLPVNSYIVTTHQIVTSTEAFIAIRHWVYVQDRRSLVEALLGERLASAVDPETFSIHKPELKSREYIQECYEAFSLSIGAGWLGGSVLMEAADQITEVRNLATTWFLLNDDFWAVLIALERIIPVAREFCRRILKRRIDQ